MEPNIDGATAAEWYSAMIWTKENPQAWSHIKARLNKDSEHGRASMQLAAEDTRSKCYVDINGNVTNINNSHLPALARIAMLENSSLEGHIELRKSKFDEVYKAEKEWRQEEGEANNVQQ